MRLTMKEKKRITEKTAGRYRRSGKKEKGLILNEFTALTGYNRSYARLVLRNHGRAVEVSSKVRIVGDVGKRTKRPRRVIYDEADFKALRTVWRVMDYICGKRLRPVLGEMAELLVRKGELRCMIETEKKLTRMSAATIDRLLKPEREKYKLKGRSHTKPGTLLKHQIPIRTFSEWDDERPGFLEIDLVGHDGGRVDSFHAFTLDATDVATGWTCLAALKNKAQEWTFSELRDIRFRLPFPLLGIDSDNGSEFINDQLFRYCQKEQITFTRSRPYRKNDACFVEQKNFSVVRRAVGYQRYEGDEQVALMNELYESLELYTNFFQPSMKLIAKERRGARVKKKYDEARTPFRRVLEAESVDEATKDRLRDKYASLNPAHLKRRIERLQSKLSKMALICRPNRTTRDQAMKMPPRRETTKNVVSLRGLEKPGQTTPRLSNIPTAPTAAG